MMAHDPSLYAGGAALNALDEEEGVLFAEHLAGCTTCQSELAGFQETAARLGSASAEAPPASMRAAVLARIAVTRQLPPQVAHSLDDEGASLQPAVAPPATVSAATPARPEPRMAEVVDLASRRRRTSKMLLTAAAAVAIALVALSAVFLLNRGRTTNDADQLRQCVDTAADQHQMSAASGSPGVSKVTVSASCGAAVVRLSDIAAPAPGKTYQLWVIAGDEVRSVGTMDPDATGSMPDTVAQVHIGDTAIGLTVEPTGGSTKPTMPPVITVPLSV